MTKAVHFGEESRNKILKGVQAITEAVRVTMGANGKCVLIGNAVYGNDGMVQLPTLVTKDGWTVTKHFELSDPVENRGAMMIKEAATKTVEQVGDATTCTCVLAEAIISKGIELINKKANSQELKRGIDAAAEYVVNELKNISTPVRGDLERVRQIATVSANNDKYIGNLIADAISKIGYDGVIDIEASKGVETEIKISDGIKFDKGWISPLFVNNPAKETCEYENPFILLYEKKITHHSQVQKALEICMAQGKPLLIICDDADEEGLAFLAVNNYQKRVMVCAVKSPEFGNMRRDWMEDIALLTGGSYVSDIRGVKIQDIEVNGFGRAKKVIVSKTETVIIGGDGNQAMIEDFVNNLKMNLTQAKTEDEKDPIEKRIARLQGGIAVIQVGAATETELKEKMDRVDDSVRATKAAIAEGFVAGGGTAFLRIPEPTTDATGYCIAGWNIVFDALETPFKQICFNAGVDGDKKLSEVVKSSGNIGYNVLTNKIEDMVEAGIIDSTKALRCALTNAVSVAGMVLTSECSITTIH